MSYNINDYTPEEQAYIRRVIEAGGVSDFAGQNCEDCSGWDGESHRCHCGNRRMYWVPNGDGTCYAEAY